MKNRMAENIALVLVFWPVLALAGEPEVTPYRPTVSNPAALSTPGLFEFEAGAARFRDDAHNRRDSLPYLFKYAFSENLGVLVGGDAYLQQEDGDGNRLAGLGDTVAALKLRQALSDHLALGAEAGIRFPTAKTGLGAEDRDYFVNGIFSVEWGGLDIDINLGYTRFGSVGAGESHSEAGWAAAIAGQLGAGRGAGPVNFPVRRGTA